MLVPCLEGFHIAKCVQHSIGKYIRGSGLDNALVETLVFGKKVIEQVLNGTHHIRSLRAILILVDSINRLKWDAFWENNKKEKYKETLAAGCLYEKPICIMNLVDQFQFY